MNYFVSREGKEYGPYTLSDLQRYVAAGSILVTDMTRSEGMTDWVPVSQVIGNIPVPVAAPPPGSAAAAPVLRREGKTLVVPRGATLPSYCVKCAQPPSSPSWEKNFSWCNPLLALLVLIGCIGIIIYLVIYYATRKQMKLSVPLCEQHHKAKRDKLILSIVLMVISPAMMIIGGIADKPELIGFGLFAFIVLLIAGAILLTRAYPLRPKKIDDFQGIFLGAGEPFLQIVASQGQQTTGMNY